MAINAIRYRHAGENRWGVVEQATVKPIAGEFATTRDFMLQGAERVRAGDGVGNSGPPLAEVEVLCPITEDRQFLCQAINYRTHMLESGLNPDASPFNIFFRKASSCLAPADTEIVKPAHVEFLDYEVEIGLVFSREVSEPTEVRADNLHDYVGALVLLNDVSARDVQLPEMQFYKGKSYRTFGPAGPYLTLVTREDLARFDSLRLELSVNGETRQDSLASDMVHKPAATLTELSSFQNWEAGDILATGTPGGCALQAPPKPIMMLAQIMSPKRRQKLIRSAARKNARRLQAGDLVETSVRTDDGEIDLGKQRNRVVAP
ncbi:MAG: fumarylacetoacetate hydrolase family protein [Myxococcales bacterium]|nr:MAG: fumarylacetoacetate hydrolase family protein [Myxococcales bacterium]